MLGWNAAVVAVLCGLTIYLLVQTWAYKWPKIEENELNLLLKKEQKISTFPEDEQDKAAEKAGKSYRRNLFRWNLFKIATYVVAVVASIWLVFIFRNVTPQPSVTPYGVAFETGWSRGWDQACDIIFGYSPDGKLYYRDTQYDTQWCRGLNQKEYLFDYFGGISPTYIAGGEPDDYQSEGFELGATVALNTVFSVVPQMCYGTECVDKDSILFDYQPLPEYDLYYD